MLILSVDIHLFVNQAYVVKEHKTVSTLEKRAEKKECQSKNHQKTCSSDDMDAKKSHESSANIKKGKTRSKSEIQQLTHYDFFRIVSKKPVPN